MKTGLSPTDIATKEKHISNRGNHWESWLADLGTLLLLLFNIVIFRFRRLPKLQRSWVDIKPSILCSKRSRNKLIVLEITENNLLALEALLPNSAAELLGEWSGTCAPPRTERAVGTPTNQHPPALRLPQALLFPSPGTLLPCTQLRFLPDTSKSPMADNFNHPHAPPVLTASELSMKESDSSYPYPISTKSCIRSFLRLLPP